MVDVLSRPNNGPGGPVRRFTGRWWTVGRSPVIRGGEHDPAKGKICDLLP
jgi:hypothetical protein